jgi:hypothetical protein
MKSTLEVYFKIFNYLHKKNRYFIFDLNAVENTVKPVVTTTSEQPPV